MDNSEDSISLAGFHKEVGNVAYMKSDYTHAMLNFKKAVELHPTNILYHNNIAAVHFKLGELEECLRVCKRAYHIGLQNHAENRYMARCLYKMACCHLRLQQPTHADHLQTLAQHKHPDADMQVLYSKFKREFEVSSKAEACFSEGRYPEAIKWYTQQLQWEPGHVEALSRRSCCYAKVLEFALSIADCNQVLAQQPHNVSMLVRKGSSLMALQRHHEAEEQFEKAWSLDRHCHQALEGIKRSSSQRNLSWEDSARLVLRDPGVRGIMEDPHVKALLSNHKPPFVLRKQVGMEHFHDIDKLVECGLVRVQR